VLERRPARDTKRPRPEELRRVEPRDLAADGQEHVLQHVLGLVATRDAREVTPEGRLNAAQDELERFAVAALRPQHPLRFLDRGRHRFSDI
jgi:hypothetical protein